jgi:hypothetical protein
LQNSREDEERANGKGQGLCDQVYRPENIFRVLQVCFYAWRRFHCGLRHYFKEKLDDCSTSDGDGMITTEGVILMLDK